MEKSSAGSDVIATVDSSTKMDRALQSMAAVAERIRPEHITKVLEIAGKIVDAQLAIAQIDAVTVRHLRTLRAEHDNDLMRADRAAGFLRDYRVAMTSEQQAEMAMLIIKITLGIDPTR